jgi:hypothetical protein
MSLAKFFLIAMVLWVPPRFQPEGEAAALERYEAIAADVAEVVERDDEPAVDGSPALTGLVVLSMAADESAFAQRVDEGHCLPKECDHGRAATMWQIHADCGLAFDGVGWRYDCSEGFRNADLVADRKRTIRMVLHIRRGTHDHRWDGPKRRQRAATFEATHPR